MQRWLKRITPKRAALEQHWCLKPFAAIIAQPGCWSFHRASVTRAFALGLFIAFIPPTPLPLHIVLCSLLGVLFRLNLPVLFATVFLSNPFTWLPQISASIWVGAKLMGIDLARLKVPLAHHHMGMGATVTHLEALFDRLWPPLLLGSLVLGALAALLGYALAQFLWRLRVAYLLRRRRAHSSSRRGALDEYPVD